MPASAEGSPTRGSSSSSVHEKRNSPHPSKEFLHFKAPSRYAHPDRNRYMRLVGESFYQDYTGGNRGDVGAGVKTKGWSAQHDTNVYLGNALCNLAHDPAAPPVVDKKDLLRNISRSYSRSILRSRSASGTRERIWSTNILEDAKKPASRPRSQSAKHLDSSHDVRSDVKRFLDSRTAEEKSEIYRYLQSKERDSRKGRGGKAESESEDKSSSKPPAKPSSKSKGAESKAPEAKSDPPKKEGEERDSPRNLKAKKSQKYKQQRVRQAQSATGTIFSVAAGRQPAHFSIFPDWPSENDPPKKH